MAESIHQNSMVWGLTIHQASRSKDLVQLMYASGHSVSYKSVRHADTALANSALARYVANNNTIIPLNFISAPLKGYIRYANDNIDIIEEMGKEPFTHHRQLHFAEVCQEKRFRNSMLNLGADGL